LRWRKRAGGKEARGARAHKNKGGGKDEEKKNGQEQSDEDNVTPIKPFFRQGLSLLSCRCVAKFADELRPCNRSFWMLGVTE
jgi:hypothetical protein